MSKVRFEWPHSAQQVLLAGSFNNWEGSPMNQSNGKWTLEKQLQPGNWQYKYVVNGNWTIDGAKPTTKDGEGNLNNYVIVEDPKQYSLKKSHGPLIHPLTTDTSPSHDTKLTTALRTRTCGELRMANVGELVHICGWVQKARDQNHFCFVDLRDRYGITQVVVPAENNELYQLSKKLGREFVLRVKGRVVERSNKNPNRETGDVEVVAESLDVLNTSLVPPFVIEDKTDANEDLRMKYRYLDIRRNPVRENLILRHRASIVIRNYLSGLNFIEVETPVLIKSTPEGARDFVVPSRTHPNTFYALPQSPQTFKQLLMVGGLDRYYQIVKCFRDEELRADRQPEFTQIDCEMSFVDQNDVIQTFEGLVRVVFKEVIGAELPELPHMLYSDAMKYYGCDKPDLRFDIKIIDMNEAVKGKGFKVFDDAEFVVGISVPGLGDASKAKITQLTNLAKSTEIGASGLVWAKYQKDGTFSSGVPKFYQETDLKKWASTLSSQPGDLLCLFAGPEDKIRIQMGRFRLAVAQELGLRDPKVFKPLWVVDFPLLEWDEEEKKWNACHHPFTSAYPEDLPLLQTNPGKVRARAYDLVINGIEVGGGSIRIHDKATQLLMLKTLGFSEERADEQFGFLMRAFEYGAPPHGGLAFGFDRLCSILGGEDTIRPFIAFPKNRDGRDTMIDTPSSIEQRQLDELFLRLVPPPAKKETPAEKTETKSPQPGSAKKETPAEKTETKSPQSGSAKKETSAEKTETKSPQPGAKQPQQAKKKK